MVSKIHSMIIIKGLMVRFTTYLTLLKFSGEKGTTRRLWFCKKVGRCGSGSRLRRRGRFGLLNGIFGLLAMLKLSFVGEEGKLSAITGRELVSSVKELLIIEQFRLKIIKRDGFVSGGKIE